MTQCRRRPARAPAAGIALGIRANRNQFLLLILINAFVGGMVGLERTVVPLIGVGNLPPRLGRIITGVHRQLRHRQRR